MINTGSSSTTIELACFVVGTRIAAQRGEVRVEEIRAGELVRLAGSDALAPVVWVGHRRVDCRRASPSDAGLAGAHCRTCVRAEHSQAGAASFRPDHAVLVDSVLVPVKYLVNGTTVAQVKVDAVTYCHVELPRHAVLLAEGLASESFLGVRDAFAGGDVPMMLHPDFSSRLWEAAACAPLAVTGPKVAAMRARLARRARGMTDGRGCCSVIPAVARARPPVHGVGEVGAKRRVRVFIMRALLVALTRVAFAPRPLQLHAGEVYSSCLLWLSSIRVRVPRRCPRWSDARRCPVPQRHCA